MMEGWGGYGHEIAASRGATSQTGGAGAANTPNDALIKQEPLAGVKVYRCADDDARLELVFDRDLSAEEVISVQAAIAAMMRKDMGRDNAK